MTKSLTSQIVDEIILEASQIAPFATTCDRSDFLTFCNVYFKDLARHAEFSVASHNRSLGLITYGAGDKFTQKVKQFLVSSEVSDEFMGIFGSLRDFFGEENLVVRQDFYESERFVFTAYWQKLVPFRILARMLLRCGSNFEILKFFDEAALLLHAASAYLGIRFVSPDRIFFKIYFLNDLEDSRSYLSPGLAALLTRSDMSALLVNYFINFYNYLGAEASGNIFTSFGFSNKSLAPDGINIDYQMISGESAIEIMNSLNISQQEKMRLWETLEIMRIKKITYLGTKFVNGKSPRLKFYFDRRFSEKNWKNSSIPVDFAKDNEWMI